MQPSIQYATTADSVSIAWCTVGRGPPLVVLPLGPWSVIQLELPRLVLHRRQVPYPDVQLQDPEKFDKAINFRAHLLDGVRWMPPVPPRSAPSTPVAPDPRAARRQVQADQ